MRRQGRSRQGIGLYLLAFQMLNVGLDKIPPVTLITVVAQVAIFLEVGDLEKWFPSASSVCISPFLVLERKQWMRLIFATFYHAHDLHLYYNMVSFMWKGMMLEKKLKSFYFAYLLAVFCVLTSVMYIGVNMVLSMALDDHRYKTSCAVGFSAIIFALKVLTTHYTPPGTQYVLGFIPVPSRMVFWAELVIIQLIVPNASFTGHLSGILVGLLYIKGPLKNIMDIFIPSEPSYTYTSRTTAGSGTPSGYRTNDPGSRQYGFEQYGTPGAGGSSQRYGFEGYSSSPAGQGPVPSASAPQYDEYTAGLGEEQQMRQATHASLNQHTDRNPNTGRLYPDLDDLRNRRQQRFQ